MKALVVGWVVIAAFIVPAVIAYLVWGANGIVLVMGIFLLVLVSSLAIIIGEMVEARR